MDVLFVNNVSFSRTDSDTFHLGQAILKQILSPFYETEIINLNALVNAGAFVFSEEEESVLEAAADYILKKGAKIIGFYTICNTFHHVVRISRLLKEKEPETTVFFGGPHATLSAWKCLEEFPFVDLVCLGESEKSILPLIRALMEKCSLEEVPGIVYRRGDEILENPCAKLITDQELTNYMQYHFEGNTGSPQNMISIEGGRGCPFRCSFCSTSRFWKGHYRVKSPETMVDEMDRFFGRYHQKYFIIEHDMFTANREHIEHFCNLLIEKGSPYCWRCSSRVDVLDEPLLQLMKKAGLSSIYLGIESGSPRMQKILHKNLCFEHAIEMISLLCDMQIRPTVSFIYGFLEETEEDFYQTVSMIWKILEMGQLQIQYHLFFPLYATEEGEKIINQAYFSPSEVETSIFDSNQCSEKTLELIKNHKELFLHFYSFPSPVRKKFLRAGELVTFLSTLEGNFSYTVRELIRENSFDALYFPYESFWAEFHRRYADLLAQNTISDWVISMLQKISQDQPQKQWTEVFRLEKAILDYRKADSEDPVILETGINVEKLLQCGKIETKCSRMILHKMGKRVLIHNI